MSFSGQRDGDREREAALHRLQRKRWVDWFLIGQKDIVR